MRVSMVAAKNLLRSSAFSKFKTGIIHDKIFLFGPLRVWFVGVFFCANASSFTFEFSKFWLVTNFATIC